MYSGIERRTTDTAFETGFLDAVENILTVEYFTHRTMRERDDYVVGYRYGRLSQEKALLQALQDIAAACSAEAIRDVETTHEGFSSSDAHAYTVGKVQAIAENAIREAAAARERENRARIMRGQRKLVSLAETA